MMPAAASRGLVEKVYDGTVQYKPGAFCHFKEDEAGVETLSSPPGAPKKAWPQNVLRYTGEPQEFEQESVLKKVIPGIDGRVRISNTTELPYSIHVQISMIFAGNEYGGSGSLVGPHHVLTCGHNVYNRSQGGWADRISVYPALNGTAAPFGVIKVMKAYTFTDWTNNKDGKFDIALLVLDQSIGFYTGWGGILSTRDSIISGKKVHVTGYPGDKNFNEMWSMGHTLKAIHAEKFDYDIDTNPGQSGSAIWIKEHGLPLILGVHTVGSNAVNSGVRISAQKFMDLFVRVITDTYKLRKIAAPVLTLAPKVQVPACAFGKAKWALHFGDVGEEPPLPEDIEQILQGPCPIWQGKKVEETHILVLIPASVDGVPLTMNSLGALVQKPKSGPASKYDTCSLGEYQTFSSNHSYWMLMSRDLLQGSRNKAWEAQFQQVATLAQTTGIPYTVPRAREAAICLFMQHVSTGQRLYHDNPWTATPCEEFTIKEKKWYPVVGGFGSKGLYVQNRQAAASENRGVGVVRKFQDVGQLNQTGASPSQITTPPTTTTTSSIVLQTKPSLIPTCAFGKAKWALHFGDVGIEPPLPADIGQILQGPCPIWKGKRVEETHVLVLIPANVGGVPLTLKSLGAIVQKPKSGPASKFEAFKLGIFKDKPVNSSYWVLMSRDVLEGSRNKAWEMQFQQVATLAQTTGIPYRVPKVREAAVCIFMHQVSTGQRLYDRETWTFTRCEEFYNGTWKMLVGGLNSGGLRIPANVADQNGFGVGVVRRL